MSLNIEHNYSNEEMNLILDSSGNINFDIANGDYIRMTVFSANTGRYIDSFYSNRHQSTGHLIPPDMINETDDVQIKIYKKDLIDQTGEDDANDEFYPSNNIFVKPNEILENNYVVSGKYILQFDFMRDTISYDNQMNGVNYIVKEISPSRREIRLILKSTSYNLDINFDDDILRNAFINNLGSLESDCIPVKDLENPNLPFDYGQDDYFVQNQCYNFDFVLTLPDSQNISINNYTFDSISFPDLPTTLILRLNEPLPSSVAVLDNIGIEKELLLTQKQEIIYYSNIKSSFTGVGLTADTSFLSDTDQTEINDTYQNYDQLVHSSSVSNNITDEINYITNNEDKNLNINYNEFTNHTFFGSAAVKLENFKYKVGKIQNQLVEISKSLEFNNSTGSDNGSAGAYSYQITRRKTAFDEITKIIKTFTPYEKWLYYDNQAESTASAPGIGKNYILNKAAYISGDKNEGEILSNYDGFNVVYKHSNENTPTASGSKVDLFKKQYYAHENPFFNYTGSIYLSFLLRGNQSITGSSTAVPFLLENTNEQQNPPLPADAFYSASVYNSSVTMSAYRPFVYQVSQSYWRPTHTASPADDTSGVTFTAASNTYEVLHGDNITGSYEIIADDGYETFPGAFEPNTPFTGSILPMGELFRLNWPSGSGAVSSSFITDIRITLNNPTGALPFGQLYETGSTTFTNWYNKMYYSASVYDNNNIHSLKNNLPEHLQLDSGSEDLKKFLGMWGEQFDSIRNYIDNYSNFYNMDYKGYGLKPDSLLPILSQNLGWELINPFSSSLADYFSTLTGSNATVETITHNTWRKTLNNLIYIYKSKGTKNSINALLNIYGYSADTLPVTEYGGSRQEQTSRVLNDNETPFKIGLKKLSGNVSFNEKRKLFYSLNLKGSRQLNVDWWTNPKTAGPDGIEFIFSANSSSNTQTLLESSGSLTASLWDLRLVKSGSKSRMGKLEFRLSTKTVGSGSLDNNAVSMSTNYVDNLKGGTLWNVYLTRTTSSKDSGISQGYKLYLARQDDDKIPVFESASMTMLGATRAADKISNINFSSGSSSPSSISGNLVVGRTFTGSISDIKTWSGSLSASKFKMHVLNKTSIVGNSLSSSQDDIVWRYRLNENHPSGTLTQSLKDSSKSYIIKNYDKKVIINNDGRLYNRHLITTYQLAPRGVTNVHQEYETTNKIISDPETKLRGDLNPYSPSFLTVYKNRKRDLPTTKISITKSPTNILNEHIYNQITDSDLNDVVGNPKDIYETKYEDLDKLKDRLVDKNNISVDFNTFVTSQESIMSPFLINALKKLLPARAELGEVGVVLKPHILDRTKLWKTPEVSLLTGSGAGVYTLNTINIPSSSISQSMEYEISPTLTLDGWFNDELTYVESSSAATAAKGLIIVSSSVSASYHGSEFTIESTDANTRTYILDATASFDVSDTPRIGIKGLTSVGQIANKISSSIAHSNGHENKIIIKDYQYFSASSDAFYTSAGKTFALGTIGKLPITQSVVGGSGNKSMVSDINPSSMSFDGFSGGMDKSFVYDLIDRKRSIISSSVSYDSVHNSNIINVPSASISESISFDTFYTFNTINLSSASISESISYNYHYDSNTINLPSASLSESIDYNEFYNFNTINVPSASISESISYSPFYNSNTINITSQSISESISYNPFYLGTIDNIIDDELVYESSSSLSTSAKGLIIVSSSNTASLAAGEFTITSTDERSITYILDATASFDVSNTPRIGIKGLTSVGQIANKISQSIAHSNGHENRIIIKDYQYFSASSAAFYTSAGKSFGTNTLGYLQLTQSSAGAAGNQTIISSGLAPSSMSFNGLSDGGNSEIKYDLIDRNKALISHSIQFDEDVHPLDTINIPSSSMSESISYDSYYNFNTINLPSASMSESINYNVSYESNTINLPSASISESISYDSYYNFNTINIPSSSMSESIDYNYHYDSNTINLPSASISESISYIDTYTSDISNIFDDEITYEASTSLGEQARALITVIGSSTASLAGGTFTITSTDDTTKTYILDATASFNVSNTPRIGLAGSTTVGKIASRISQSIAHTNGHDGRIIIKDYQYFSSSNGAFSASNGAFGLTSIGKLPLTQSSAGGNGNQLITSTNISSLSMSFSGFDYGSDSTTTYDVVDRKKAIISHSIGYKQFFDMNAIHIVSGSRISQSIEYDEVYNSSTIDIPSSSISESISYNYHYDSNNINLPSASISESISYNYHYGSNNINLPSASISESISYSDEYSSNTINLPSASISESIEYETIHTGDINNINKDIVTYGKSLSALVKAKGKITFTNSPTSASLHGATFKITSTDGTLKTYTFDATETFDVSDSPTVGIKGQSSMAKIATYLSQSIAHTNGHNIKLEINDYQHFSASSDAFITAGSKKIALKGHGTLPMTQSEAGSKGNQEIISTVATVSAKVTTVGFDEGSDTLPTYTETSRVPSYVSKSIEWGETATSSITFIADINVRGKGRDLHGESYPTGSDYWGHGKVRTELWETWGRGLNDTHFINEQRSIRPPTQPAPSAWNTVYSSVVSQVHDNPLSQSNVKNLDSTPATGSYNVNHYNHIDNFVIDTIGDKPYMFSQSLAIVSCSGPAMEGGNPDYDNTCHDYYNDHMNYKNYTGEVVINPDVGLDKDVYTHKTYIKDANATVKGRPLGPTTYFTASAASTVAEFNRGEMELIYPENHYINVHSTKQQLRKAYYGGSVGKLYSTALDRNEISTSLGGVGDIVIDPTHGGKIIETKQNLGSSSIEFPSSVKDEFPTKQVYSISVDGADTDNVLRVDSVNKRTNRGRKK